MNSEGLIFEILLQASNDELPFQMTADNCLPEKRNMCVELKNGGYLDGVELMDEDATKGCFSFTDPKITSEGRGRLKVLKQERESRMLLGITKKTNLWLLSHIGQIVVIVVATILAAIWLFKHGYKP